jgi:hypothetical protein
VIPEGRPRRRVLVGLWLMVVLIGAGIALRAGRGRYVPRGNALIVINTGSGGLDSIVVEPAPPAVGTDPPPGPGGPSGRAGYVAAQDSLIVSLTATAGDAHLRAWRDGRPVADQVVYFGGETFFELRVGDRDRQGRYRRTR